MEAKDTKSIPIRLDVLGADGKIIQSGEFVKDKIVIGRVLSADLRIDDARVSRIHALLESRNDELVITDLASSHGTFVNGKKIVESRLKFGDRFKLGFVEIQLENGSGNVFRVAPHESGAEVVDDNVETLVDLERS